MPWLDHIKRRVQHYGYEFDYATRHIDAKKPLGGLPGWADDLIEELIGSGHLSTLPDQITVNEYPPGVGIAPHVDTHSAFEEDLVSLTLGGATVMEMKHPDGRVKLMHLVPGSLLVLKGESRYLWTHGIMARKVDRIDGEIAHRTRRVSVTMRKVRKGPCCCKWASACDSQLRDDSNLKIHTVKAGSVLGKEGESKLVGIVGIEGVCISKEEEEEEVDGGGNDDKVKGVCRVPLLEYEHVWGAYQGTSPPCQYMKTVERPRVEAWLQSLPDSTLVLNVGCGQGDLMRPVCGRLVMMGCDISSRLVAMSSDAGKEAIVADALVLPWRTGAFGAVICVSMIQHLSSRMRRIMAIKEVMRVCRPGGRCLFYAPAALQAGDGVAHPCCCHPHAEGELEGLAASAPGCVVEDSFHDDLDPPQWCAVLRKTFK